MQTMYMTIPYIPDMATSGSGFSAVVLNYNTSAVNLMNGWDYFKFLLTTTSSFLTQSCLLIVSCLTSFKVSSGNVFLFVLLLLCKLVIAQVSKVSRKTHAWIERPTLGFEEVMQIFAFSFIKPPVLTGIVKKAFLFKYNQRRRKNPSWFVCRRERERHLITLYSPR